MKNHGHIQWLTLFFAVFAGVFGAQQQAQAQRGEDYKIREARVAAPVRLQLENLRKNLQVRNKKFRVGYTYALERGVENVSGGIIPNVSADAARKQNALAEQLLRIDDETRRTLGIPLSNASGCSANATAWDWRRAGKVPPIRTQQCNSCWAYAAVAVYEINYLIRNNLGVNLSEQYVVSNNDNKAGKCELPGGRSDLANEFLVTNGTTSETIMPDTGVTGTPDATIQTPYNGVTWGWADPDNHSSPSAQKIKESICKYGGVASWIDSGGSFRAYAGGGDDAGSDVYNDDDDKAAGFVSAPHYVALIGWDDTRNAWLVRNSWGTDWGFNAGFGSESGYGWVKQGTHSIGSWVSWVLAPGAVYPLPQRYYDLMPMKRRLIKVPLPINRPPPIRRP